MSERQAGLALLQQRVAALPDWLAEAARAPEPALAVDAARVRRWLVTGIGSSSGHARFLASVLSEELNLPAQFVSTGALANDPGGDDSALIVFSQGLSPNAMFALDAARRWGRVVLVTGVAERQTDPQRVARLRAAQAEGVCVVALPAALGEESGALLRVAGPVVAYVAALSIARSVARDLGLATDVFTPNEAALRAAARSAPERIDALFAPHLPLPFGPEQAIALIASGGAAERAHNLAKKFEEGLLRAAPGCWDVFEYVHGPFQQLYERDAALLFLARSDAPDEDAALQRLRETLPERHVLHVLRAELPGAFASIDHELLCNALVLRAMAEQGVAASDWPGRGRDAPLYDWTPESAVRRSESVRAQLPLCAGLEHATSPEVAAALAAGQTTAVLPLGSTEQHGAHLPLATDTLIGDALAARFCARVPEAQRCPTLPLGCASEHLSFAGTLSLSDSTLEAILEDVARSLNRHGFSELFVFSAHGGNAGALETMSAALATRVSPLRVIVFSDQSKVGKACVAAAAGFGVAAEAVGHHAGEFETSIVAALRAGAVRAITEPGLLDVPRDSQSIFYPDLRANAPNGVVGDPRGFAAERAETYLAAWVDVLESAYRAAKKRSQTKGTQSA